MVSRICSIALLAVACLAAGAAAQVAAQEDTQPSVNTEDGNMKINIPRGKVFGAGLVTADGTTKVDLIQKIQQLKQRLQALKDSAKEPDWAKANLGRTTGTDFITGGEKTMSLGYFGQNQGIKVEVKVDGCGIYQGRRFTVVTSQKWLPASGTPNAQPPFLKAGESNPLLDVEVYEVGAVNNQVNDQVSIQWIPNYHEQTNEDGTTFKAMHYWLMLRAKQTRCPNEDAPVAKVDWVVTVSNGGPETEDNYASKINRMQPARLISLDKVAAAAEDIAIVVNSESQLTVTDEMSEEKWDQEACAKLAKPTKYLNYKDTQPVGLFRVSQTARLRIEVRGCALNMGISFVVQGTVGAIEDGVAKPTAMAYHYGSDTDHWKGVRHSSVLSVKLIADPEKPIGANAQYYLYVVLDNRFEAPGGGAFCPKVTGSTTEIDKTVKLTTTVEINGALLPYDREKAEKLMKTETLVNVTVGDLATTVNAALASYPQRKYLSYPPAKTSYLYLGKYSGASVLDVDVESTGCYNRNMGHRYSIVSRPGNLLYARPEVFMMGSAASDFGQQQDKIKLVWLPSADVFGKCSSKAGEVRASTFVDYHLWVEVQAQEQKQDGSGFVCADASHALVASVKSLRPAKELKEGETVPDPPTKEIRFTNVRTNEEQNTSQYLAMTVVEDLAEDLDVQPLLAGAFNVQQITEEWASTLRTPTTTTTPNTYSKYLGRFRIDDVIHIDIENTGCNQAMGLFINLVARAGVLQLNYCAEDKVDCRPEAFSFGAGAGSVKISNTLQLYYKKLPRLNGGQYRYDLFVGVIENQCTVYCQPSDKTCDRDAINKSPDLAKAWAEKNVQPKTISITLRSANGALNPRYFKVPAPADGDLQLKPDGSFSTGFAMITRTDMSQIAGGMANAPQPKVFGTAVDVTSGEPYLVMGTDNFKFAGGAALPMQLHVTDHWAYRTIRANWAESKVSVLDATGAAAYTPSMDARTGYILVGVFNGGSVITFDLEDRKQMQYAEHITCKMGMTGDQKVVQCFRYGSDGFNDCMVRVVFNTVGYGKNYVWVSTKLNTNSAARITRDVVVNLHHTPGKYSNWPQNYNLDQQKVVKGYLEQALAAAKKGPNPKGGLGIAQRGVVGIHSMDRMAQKAGMWSSPSYTNTFKCRDGL